MLRQLNSIAPHSADPTHARHPVFICVVSAAFLAICLPRPGWSPIAWFALAPPIYFSAQARSYRRAALLGWLSGLTCFLAALHWIFSTCRFAEVPLPIALLAWFSLAAVLGLSWAAGAALTRWARAAVPPWLRPWACAAGWTAAEFFFSMTPFGIFRMGYTQWRFPAWIQGVSWTGVAGLSFLVVLANGFLALWWESVFLVPSSIARRRRLQSTFAAAALILGWWGYGVASLRSRRTGGVSIPVAILQPNIDQYQKWDARYVDEIRNRIDRLVDAASATPVPVRPRLVLWPESSAPGWLEESDNFMWMRAAARRSRIAQLIGVASGARGQEHNSAVLLEPDGRIAGMYHKRQLVPFGEWVPLRPLLAPWIGILDQMGDFQPGPADPQNLQSPVGPLGATICYESAYPRWVRLDARRGARVVANLTNDGWYKDTWGPYQHFYVNVFRAVENRVTILRAANTGISGVIDPYGIVAGRLGLNRRGVLLADIPERDDFPGRSFYCRRGDWFAWSDAVGLLLMILWFSRQRLVERAAKLVKRERF